MLEALTSEFIPYEQKEFTYVDENQVTDCFQRTRENLLLTYYCLVFRHMGHICQDSVSCILKTHSPVCELNLNGNPLQQMLASQNLQHQRGSLTYW